MPANELALSLYIAFQRPWRIVHEVAKRARDTGYAGSAYGKGKGIPSCTANPTVIDRLGVILSYVRDTD